jgi:hypothetical protein
MWMLLMLDYLGVLAVLFTLVVTFLRRSLYQVVCVCSPYALLRLLYQI